MPKRLLIAEDDAQVGALLVRSLTAHNFVADHYLNGAEAREQLRWVSYDLLILDWELPGLPGLELCKQYRAAGGNAPILMLTARRELDDKENGFSAGADDYLTKPFSSREVIMRVEALLKRPPLQTSDKLQVGELVLEPNFHRVLFHGKEIVLSKKEFALLEFFMRHPEDVFDAATLLARVWPSGSEASDHTVLNYITKLRQKVNSVDGQPIIESIHGVGYRLRRL